MSRTVFMSYQANDNAFKSEIKKWLEKEGLEIVLLNEAKCLPEDDDTTRDRITKQIISADVILILVGNDKQERPWVNYELTVARRINRLAFWIRLPTRVGRAPKEVKKVTCIKYNKENLLQTLKHLK